MRQLMITSIIMALMGSIMASDDYPDCFNCTDNGARSGSISLSPLSYNTMRSNEFNGTQPGNEGCTNGVSIDGQVTIDCGQGTILIDCGRGFNGGDYSDLSSTFAWNRTTSVNNQVSIVFRFYQQINISRISMLFWNSPSNSIIVPTVMMYWSNDDSITPSDEISVIIRKPPVRTGNVRRRMNIDINNERLQFQYLRIEMSFYGNSEWIFLGEVSFCGNTAPYRITQPSTDYDVQIVSSTATMATLTCSLNVTIPSNAIVSWIHNNAIPIPGNNVTQTGNTTTLLIENLQLSDAGVYQCSFDFAFDDGSRWLLRRNIRLIITEISVSATTTSTSTPATTSTPTTTTSTSITTGTPTTATMTSSVATTVTTTISTMTTVTTPNNATGVNTSESSDNIGAIIASIIVVILLIAIVVTVLIILFFWRKKRKAYHVYDNGTELSDQPPSYVNVHSASTKEKGKIDGTPTTENVDCNQNPSLIYAVPSKREKRERRKSVELQKRMSIEFNYKPQRSPEMSVRSRKQTLSLINPDYEQTMEFDIYGTPPEIPARTEASHCMIYDETEKEENPIYSEAINPAAIVTSSSQDYSTINDDLCPYSSIYADPLPLVKSEGPPVVSSKNIKPLHQLGVGQFGEVILAETVGLSYRYLDIGNSNDTTVSMKVAVKTLKSSPSKEVRKSFEKEIKFMSRLKDDNVIKLLGICTTGTPFIMMEYMENGDLNNYLQKFEFTYETEKLPAANEITLNALVYMSYQVASGMKYLASRKFIHRDLAARNILVGVDFTVKVADFGMSQNLYSEYYCRVSGQKVLPVRWMAYECFYGKFSVLTDVWGFGITLWEIFTLCRHWPFENLSDQEMINDAIKGANRRIPEQPEICPDDIYYIMKSCWRHEPSERAKFSVLCDQLNDYYSNIL